MCSDPLDPGGAVDGCSVGCTLSMSDILALRVAAALNLHMGFLELKKCIFKRVFLGAAGFRVFFSFFFLRTHTACCKYEAGLPHLPLDSW